MTNVSLERVFEMSFLTLSNVDVNFLGWKIRWKTYITKKTLFITRYVKLVGKKEFSVPALDLECENYIIHVESVSFVMSPSSLPFDVYPSLNLR